MESESRPRTLTWGWTEPDRRLVAVLALVLAASLGPTKLPERSSRPAPVPSLVVDPNVAPAAVLVALPRLGPALVGRIVNEREKRPFDSLDDLDSRVKGIGPATVAVIRPHIAFASPAR